MEIFEQTVTGFFFVGGFCFLVGFFLASSVGGKYCHRCLGKQNEIQMKRRKMKCQMSQPILFSTEHGHLLNMEGNRNNSGVCFTIS